MSLTIYPCVWHNQTAREAAEFYQLVLPACSIIEENPVAVQLQVFDKKILLLNGGPQFMPNPSISFFLYARSAQEAKEIFEQLSEGGKVLMPFEKYPWAAQYGWIEDRYHTSWQITWDENYPQTGELKPSLLFANDVQGKAQEAIDFYSSVFPQHMTLQIERYPAETGATAGQIMFSEIELEKQRFILMDSGIPHAFDFNEGVSFVLECNDQEEIDYYWEKFTGTGTESMCGWCSDQYNVFWQVIPRNFTSMIQSPQAVEAFMKMRKIEIDVLKNA